MTAHPIPDASIMAPPIERAARAAYAADWPEPHHASWEETAEDMRKRYRDIVRAVLQAIREPSEGMVAAGTRREVAWEFGDCGDPDTGPHVPSHANWLAMIDAALEDR